MKNMSKKTVFGTAVLCMSLSLANPILAEDQADESKEIKEIVSEAQRVAKEMTARVLEWKSQSTKPKTYLGVVIERVPDVLRDYVDLPDGVGLLLPHISKDSPAERAGLQDNDIIVTYDGQLIINYSQLSTLIDMKGAGVEIPITILRKGEKMELTIIPEERLRGSSSFVAPDAPGSPDSPGMDEIGVFMDKIDEWIPGSVKVYVDQNEQVHVDLQDLKENLQDLKVKVARIRSVGTPKGEIITEHGDMGARTTIVHVEDRNINYHSNEGRLSISSSEAGQQAMVWDSDDELIYQGEIPDNYEEELPSKAVDLINSYYNSQDKLHLEANGEEFDIELNEDAIDSFTFFIE